MEQILSAYLQETFTTIIILYKNTNVMVHSLNGDTDFSNIIVGVWEGDTPDMFTSIDVIKDSDFILKVYKQLITLRN